MESDSIEEVTKGFTEIYYSKHYSGKYSPTQTDLMLHDLNGDFIMNGMGMDDDLIQEVVISFYDEIPSLIFFIFLYEIYHQDNIEFENFLKKRNIIYKKILENFNEVCPKGHIQKLDNTNIEIKALSVINTLLLHYK